MKKVVGILLIGFAAVLALVSCQLEFGTTGLTLSSLRSRAIELPSGAVLLEAKLSVSVRYVSEELVEPQQVKVYRVTVGWDESTVTWNNFYSDPGGSYDPVLDPPSFWVDGSGTYEVDITDYMNGWIGGAYSNFGVLLVQEEENAPYIIYASSEYFNPVLRPALIITYIPDGGVAPETIVFRDTDTSNDLPDAAIVDDSITGGYLADTALGVDEGWYFQLDTGTYRNKILQSLIGFDLIATEYGCTNTIGYWKNHSGLKKQADEISPLLPIWLGSPLGVKSLSVDTRDIAVDVLTQKIYGDPSNGITKLYAQLLAAKLNIAGGAGDNAVDEIIAAADEFLADHDHTDWDLLLVEEREVVLGWATMLDAYNNGIIGPGHCEDD